MKKRDLKEEIAKRQRAAIRSFMMARDLKVAPWCKKAGITEGTLRGFLNGDIDSMGIGNLELLAMCEGVTIGQLLEGSKPYTADDSLMRDAADAIQKVASIERKKLSLLQAMQLTVELYNHVITYRKQGVNAAPDEAMASLIIKKSA